MTLWWTDVVIDLPILYWWDVFERWWWLRSTTSFYGRLEIEATYGEIVISLHRGCLKDVSSERGVGMLTWCITHGRHTRINTSVDTLYVFSTFNTNSIHIMFWKSICIMKKTLVIPDVVLAWRRSENIFDRPWCFF